MSHPTPESLDVIKDFRDTCVRSVREAVGVELDGSQDTLPVLDHYLREIPDASAGEVLSLMVPMCGTYFGEVIRTHLAGARWHAPSGQYQEWRIEFDGCFLSFNPIGMVFEGIMQQEQAGWRAHLNLLDRDRSMVDEALARLGDVRPDDFFRVSTRFEVIETAYMTLINQAKPGDSYSPNVYVAANPTDDDDGQL
jgi:hypothetical protein